MKNKCIYNTLKKVCFDLLYLKLYINDYDYGYDYG